MLENDGRVVSNFIVQSLKGEKLTVYGEGKQTRSFCYIDDMIRGLVGLMEQNQTVGPINIGNPNEYTIIDLATKITEKINPSLSIRHDPVPSDDPKKRKPDITLAKQYLKWEPQVPLDQGLDKTIEYFQSIKDELM
jgi:UDP-glucuronate decarboxylase